MYSDILQKQSPAWGMLTQVLKSFVENPELQKPEVGQNIAVHDSPTTSNFFLSNFCLTKPRLG